MYGSFSGNYFQPQTPKLQLSEQLLLELTWSLKWRYYEAPLEALTTLQDRETRPEPQTPALSVYKKDGKFQKTTHATGQSETLTQLQVRSDQSLTSSQSSCGGSSNYTSALYTPTSLYVFPIV